MKIGRSTEKLLKAIEPAVRKKVELNNHKGDLDKDGLDYKWLLSRLNDEIAELAAEIYCHDIDLQQVIDESADVIIFASMIIVKAMREKK